MVQAPVFNPGPSLPSIPGATVTVGAPQTNPFPARPAAPAPSAPTPQASQGFDLNGLVNSFPGVANAVALEQQGLGQLDAQLRAARERAIINFGDPALASMAGFGLDPQAGTFAQQNYLSGNATMARLDKAHQLAAQGIINNLAGRGILNSGDLGYREGQENQAYGNNVYDAQQTVLQQLADLYNSYLNSRYGLEQNANNAQLSALQSFLANPDAYSTLFGPGGGAGGKQFPPGTSPDSPATVTKTPKQRSLTQTDAKAITGPRIGAFK